MADEVDRASEHEERYREFARMTRRQVPEHDGHCLNCGEESEGAYCDMECREDAERFERAKQRNGF
jgi:hypothetical protein